MKKYKKIKDYPAYEKNPFSSSTRKVVEIEYKEVSKTEERREIQLVVENQDRKTEHTAMVQYIEVGESEFKTNFLEALKSYWGIPDCSIRVLDYILTLPVKKDIFEFDMATAQRQTGYATTKSIFEGISGLLEAGIVARSTKHYQYFFNASVGLKSSRITFTKIFVKKKKNKTNQTDLFE
jgi:hypothetical protein